jgi:hypothetical protein
MPFLWRELAALEWIKVSLLTVVSSFLQKHARKSYLLYRTQTRVAAPDAAARHHPTTSLHFT